MAASRSIAGMKAPGERRRRLGVERRRANVSDGVWRLTGVAALVPMEGVGGGVERESASYAASQTTKRQSLK